MPQFSYENTRPETAPTSNTLVSVGARALDSEVLSTSLIEEHLPGVEGVAKEVLPVLDGKATFIVGAEVTGPWHYSSSRIEEFSREGAEASRGKLGTGSYFGVGDLTGETVDGLKSDGSIKYQVGFSGNILAVDRDGVVEVSRLLDEMHGRRLSRLRMPIAPIADRAKGAAFEGHPVQAVMVYMDPTKQTGELVVLPEAVDGVVVIKDRGIIF